ncbi:hypothetical protein GCM10010121_082410 [Streptomyces brasiliensis]|uniref:Uncharacterized protein n=1 Tax=Streptomyces brasiliensis TaxID=1954 RepID=A0A917P357_9ACTN|nr:hypothetical protein GCM10010121_082410 [Streptomyces brasiliensis]
MGDARAVLLLSGMHMSTHREAPAHCKDLVDVQEPEQLWLRPALAARGTRAAVKVAKHCRRNPLARHISQACLALKTAAAGAGATGPGKSRTS